MSTINKRSNLWAFVGYPDDSLPKNYLSIIQSWHVPCLISPIHDKDKNADNTEKKKHIHFMLYFGSGANKSYDQVKALSDQLKGTIPIIVNNADAMTRYFIHIDNPEKQQGYTDDNGHFVKWSKKDLTCISGFEIKNAFDSFSNDTLIYESIETLIKEEKIYNFYILIVLLQKRNMTIELDFLRRHSFYFKEIINARFQLLSKGIDFNKIDKS